MAIPKYNCNKPIRYTIVVVLLFALGQKSLGQALPEKKDSSRYEWEFDKNNRWQKEHTSWLACKNDSLRRRLKNRFIISGSWGYFFIPGNARGEVDKNTGVDMAAIKKVLGANVEFFVDQKSRIGVEVQWHSAPQKINMTTNGSGTGVSINAAGGNSILLFGYYKQTICNLFSANRMENKIGLLQTDTLNEGTIKELNRTSRKLNSIPRLYGILGIGIVSTNLLRVKGSGSPDNMNVKVYNQKPYAAEAGVGFFSRTGKHIFLDLAFKYILSTAYSPEIGGLKSYTGLKLQLNVGWMINAGFSRLKSSDF